MHAARNLIITLLVFSIITIPLFLFLHYYDSYLDRAPDRNPVRNAIYHDLDDSKLQLDSSVGDWIKILGPPKKERVNKYLGTFRYKCIEKDNLYYWSQFGVMIYAHPEYRGQCAKIGDVIKWKVTSIIIPLKKDIILKKAYVLGPFHFNRIRDIRLYGKKLKYFSKIKLNELYPQMSDSWYGETRFGYDLFYFFEQYRVNAYFEQERLNYIEVFNDADVIGVYSPFP